MLDKIQNDIKDAMRAKDELRLSVLRMLSSAIHNREIEKKTKSGEPELSDEEILAVIRSEVKKRRDAVDGFTKGGRMDMAEKEQAESKILESYLPQELSDEEIEKIVKEVIMSMGEVTAKDFGKVMGMVIKKIGGQAGGNRVSAMVKKLLI
ncbi:MAG TPA: aspartyl-tRNA amidotransferase [Candidatus Jacksonbacteria bacterium]|nr:MAG: GatB/YqeY [Parcubacteria group bacterium GW2011_GWA2_45_30]HCE86330.1 aspartyl-tRNA amidotransferase [Candidatus Jacksonbacteria bacterium]